MGFLKIFLLLFVSSCAQTSYIWHVGMGQLNLEWDGRKNEEVLADQKVKQEWKDKIRLIISVKNFFYQQMQEKPTDIYDETTLLKNEAVSYLVIASPIDRIQAKKFSFPIVGSFPYKGYFDPKKAKEFASELEEENLFTYIRPVYAYSTLNKWIYDDNILSSFFVFDQYDLTHLIFHELVHTVFFIDDEVWLNEHLADLIADKLSLMFWDKEKVKYLGELKLRQKKEKEWNKIMHSFTQNLNKELIAKRPKDKEQASRIKSDIFNNQVKSKVEKFCHDYQLKKCRSLASQWNNASLAHFMTYNGQKEGLIQWARKFIHPKDLLDALKKGYHDFRKNDLKAKTYWEYLQKVEKEHGKKTSFFYRPPRKTQYC